MNQDIVSLFLLNDGSNKLIRKIYRIAGILVIAAISFALLDLAEWYVHLSRLSASAYRLTHFVFIFRVTPLITVIIIFLEVYIAFNQYFAWKAILNAISSSDPILLNNAFHRFFRIYVLNIVSFGLATLRILYSLLFVK